MKKLKLNLGDGGLQGWLIRHVEKFVLVLFAAVMVWFVISGSRLEGMKTAQAPDDLKKKAQETQAYVTQSRWDVVQQQPERKVEPNVEGRVKDLLVAVANSDNYRLASAWNKPLVPKLMPRRDPAIYGPEHVKVVSVEGPLAYLREETDVDPLEPAAVEDEDPKKSTKKPAPKKPKKTAAAPAGMVGPMAGMAGMPGMPGAKTAGGKKGKASAAPAGMGAAMPGMDGDEAGGMAGMMGMMQGMAGMGGAGGGKQVDEMVIGYRPPQGSMVRIARANIVMAVVPYEKQEEEFDAALANSLDYDVARDKPHYLIFGVQRADVTDNPAAEGPVLEELFNKEPIYVSASLDALQTWAGAPHEVMDPAYLMPLYARGQVGLTLPLPPFVQRNLYDAMTHPDIPLAAPATVITDPSGRRRPKKPGEAGGGEDEIPTGAAGAGGLPGMAGGMAGMAGGMPGMAGMAGGMPGMAGAGGMPGMAGAAGMGGAEAGMPGAAGGTAGMMGMAGGMMGMGGGMMGMGGYGMSEKLVKYKLIRYVDLTAEKGHQYRYRVRVFLEDPNYPSASYAAPSLAGLDDKVRARIRARETAEKGAGKKTTYLASEFSPPSDVASSPPSEWFYAGKVVPDSTQVLAGTQIKVRTSEGSATALAVVQDEKKAVDVPAKHPVMRGSALNFTEEVEVIHPVFGDKRKLEKYSFQTNAVVADIRGGEEIPAFAHDRPIKAPGEILFVDSAGNMHVQDEVQDIDSFRRFVGVEEEEGAKKKKKDEDAVAPGDFGGMMMMGPMGIPGASGGGVPGAPKGTKPKR